jgi:hypothetical protein
MTVAKDSVKAVVVHVDDVEGADGRLKLLAGCSGG